MERPDLYVVNVAGLMMNGKGDGLEREMEQQLAVESIQTIAPTPAKVAAFKSPQYAMDLAGELMDEALSNIPDDAEVIGVGRSYGGFTLLKAALAVRDRWERFKRLIVLEAPMNPDHEVVVPRLLVPLHVCKAHYAQRQAFAQEIVESLSELGTGKIVSIGQPEDAVVNPDAMHLPGDFNHVSLQDSDNPSSLDFDAQGHAITLATDYEPTTEGASGILPRPYRMHLNWNPEKYAMIMRIISAASQ